MEHQIYITVNGVEYYFENSARLEQILNQTCDDCTDKPNEKEGVTRISVPGIVLTE